MRVDSDGHTLMDFMESDDPDLFGKARAFADFLDDWKRRGSYTYHRALSSSCPVAATCRAPETGKERDYIVLASNNYLGLSRHPDLIAAAKDALDRYGTGMCGSRFLTGTYELLEQLEHRLAKFEHKEAAMVFTSGYQANVGTISALLRAQDVAVIDRLCHASIVDGCRMSGAPFRAFRHNDAADLERILERLTPKYKGKLVIVDGIFSMDGDRADLPAVVKIAHKYGARILVDEAHGTGVVGSAGRGATEYFGLCDEVDIVLGTFSKALAATGGFIAAAREVVDYVRHYGRSYMFSASPTPVVAASVLAGLNIVEQEPERRDLLWERIRHFHGELKRLGLPVFPDPPDSAIVTVPVGDDIVIREVSRKLDEAGLFASSVAYPVVSRNRSRLRLSISAAHSVAELDRAARILQRVWEACELPKAGEVRIPAADRSAVVTGIEAAAVHAHA